MSDWAIKYMELLKKHVPYVHARGPSANTKPKDSAVDKLVAICEANNVTDTGKFWALPESQQFIKMSSKINGLLTNIFQHQCARKRAEGFRIPADFVVKPDRDVVVYGTLNPIFDFLRFQNFTEKQIYAFGKNMMRVMKGGNKKNTMYLWGVSNAGKTTLALNFVNTFFEGAIGRPLNQVRSSFRFQDCINKAVILWEEPQILPEETEDCKLLFGGQQVPANVKYQGSVAVPPTPVIITSNQNINNLFRTSQYDTVWENRAYTYAFRYAITEEQGKEWFGNTGKYEWYEFVWMCNNREKELNAIFEAAMEPLEAIDEAIEEHCNKRPRVDEE